MDIEPETASLPALSCGMPMRACITIESAPPEASQTVTSHDGSLRLVTRVSGELGELEPDGCVLTTKGGRRIRLRMVLPPHVQLDRLVGKHVTVFTALELSGDNPSGLEASILCPAGTTLLWVRDGSPPRAGGPFGVAWDDTGVRIGGQALRVGVSETVLIDGAEARVTLLHSGSLDGSAGEASVVVSTL